MSEGDYMASMNPVGWIPQQALSLPDLWEALGRHHPPGHPVSYYMILVIFFEETAFCDISQLGTSGNLGCGFGQLEMSNPEKLPFYAWADLPLDYKKVAAGIAAREGVSKKRAGAMLAASTRRASKSAKRKNPRLKRVRG